MVLINDVNIRCNQAIYSIEYEPLLDTFAQTMSVQDLETLTHVWRDVVRQPFERNIDVYLQHTGLKEIKLDNNSDNNPDNNELEILNEEMLHKVIDTKQVPSSESGNSDYDEWLNSEDEMKMMILPDKPPKEKKKNINNTNKKKRETPSGYDDDEYLFRNLVANDIESCASEFYCNPLYILTLSHHLSGI